MDVGGQRRGDQAQGVQSQGAQREGVPGAVARVAGGGAVRRGGRQVIPRPESWQPGGPAPWMSSPAQVTLDHVRSVVSRLAGQPKAPPDPVLPPELVGRRPAAVLVPLFQEGDDVHVVLTRRAAHLRAHRGEVSFPGGRAEPGESLVDAALREAHEEIGLDPGSVEVIGELGWLTTFSSGATVTPFVGLLAKRPSLVPNPDEVERVFDVALSTLWLEGVFREERWDVPNGPSGRPVFFFEIDDDTIWGATARILHQLLGLVAAEAGAAGAGR